MKVKHVYNPLSGEMDLINTEESKTNVPKFEEIVDHPEFEVTSGSSPDAGEVVFLATDKIFVWRTERGYFRNWATVLDYMTAWDGMPIKHRLFECNGQYYVFDGESLVHSTVNIGGSGIELVHGLGDSTEKAMSQAAVTNLYNQGYKLVGTATPSTTPIALTGDEKVFYIATEEGDYSNFSLGNISELSLIKSENGSWSVEGLGIPTGLAGEKNIYIDDFSTFDSYELQVVGNRWVSGGTPVSIIIPVKPNREYEIKGTGNRTWYFSLLKNRDNISADSVANVCDEINISDTVFNGGRYQGSSNSIVKFITPSDCSYIAITSRLGSTDTTPIYIKANGTAGIIDDIAARVYDLEKFNTVDTIAFEQGTIAFANGNTYPSDVYIRSNNYISTKDYDVLLCDNHYNITIYYYDSEYNYINYVRASNTMHIEKAYPYFKITIGNGSSITPESEIPFYAVSDKDGESLVGLYSKDLYLMSNLFSPNNTNRTNLINVADSHGMKKCVELGGIVKSIVGNSIYVNTGDMVDLEPKDNNILSEDVAQYMNIAKKNEIYHCMGQHEVGFQNLNFGYDGKLKSNCLTHDEVFDTFINPMLPFWNLPEESEMIANKQIYYYKDFPSQNLRLFSLYQFAIPLIDDHLDSSKYKYIRSSLWYGQEQINWLVSRLNDTPSGYYIIILLHQADGRLIDNDGKSNFSIKGGSVSAGNSIMSEFPVRDIIDAFINKSTLTKTYTGEQSYDATNDNADYTDLSLTVNADFSSSKANFGMYICGDSHVDIIGTMNSQAKQFGICTSSSKTPSDIALGIKDKSTFVTGYSVSSNFKNIRIARIGADTSIYVQNRRIDKFEI